MSKKAKKRGGSLPYQPQGYHTLAVKRGFKWLGPKVGNVITKTKWQCKKGHIWQATYKRIREGRNCHKCVRANRQGYRKIATRKTPKDYWDLAKIKNIVWVGGWDISNVRTKTNWACPECEHEWESSYFVIKKGKGCPACNKRARVYKTGKGMGRPPKKNKD